MRLRLLAAATAVLASSLAAKADTVLYSQSPVTSAGWSSYAGSYNAADGFSLSTAATVNSLSFYGLYGGSAPTADQFTESIFSSANGAPGTLLESVTVVASKVDTGSNLFGDYEVYKFSNSLPAFLATANTAYFLQIVSTSSSGQFALVNGTGGDGTHEQLAPGSSTYANANQDLAFSLAGSTAATPEPSSLALLGTGILGLAGAIRRRLVA